MNRYEYMCVIPQNEYKTLLSKARTLCNIEKGDLSSFNASHPPSQSIPQNFISVYPAGNNISSRTNQYTSREAHPIPAPPHIPPSPPPPPSSTQRSHRHTARPICASSFRTDSPKQNVSCQASPLACSSGTQCGPPPQTETINASCQVSPFRSSAASQASPDLSNKQTQSTSQRVDGNSISDRRITQYAQRRRTNHPISRRGTNSANVQRMLQYFVHQRLAQLQGRQTQPRNFNVDQDMLPENIELPIDNPLEMSQNFDLRPPPIGHPSFTNQDNNPCSIEYSSRPQLHYDDEMMPESIQCTNQHPLTYENSNVVMPIGDTALQRINNEPEVEYPLSESNESSESNFGNRAIETHEFPALTHERRGARNMKRSACSNDNHSTQKERRK